MKHIYSLRSDEGIVLTYIKDTRSHTHALPQYPGGDCSSHLEKCQIFKYFPWRDPVVNFPPGRGDDVKTQRVELYIAPA